MTVPWAAAVRPVKHLGVFWALARRAAGGASPRRDGSVQACSRASEPWLTLLPFELMFKKEKKNTHTHIKASVASHDVLIAFEPSGAQPPRQVSGMLRSCRHQEGGSRGGWGVERRISMSPALRWVLTALPEAAVGRRGLGAGASLLGMVEVFPAFSLSMTRTQS